MYTNYVTEKENKFRVFTVPEFKKFLDKENTLKYAVYIQNNETKYIPIKK